LLESNDYKENWGWRLKGKVLSLGASFQLVPALVSVGLSLTLDNAMICVMAALNKPQYYTVACLVHQSLSGQAPLYLADDCCVVFDNTRRSLRSADVPTCVVSRTLSSYGDRTFAAAGCHLWNSLLVQLWSPDTSYGLFRWQLKGHLFREAWTWCSVTSYIQHLRKALTYLLLKCVPQLQKLACTSLLSSMLVGFIFVIHFASVMCYMW